ncbi:hypothetical protein PIB30_108804, partial [Stylosanthes scabra]|nr:hypothetical protein [Stylosanthes scabra]
VTPQLFAHGKYWLAAMLSNFGIPAFTHVVSESCHLRPWTKIGFDPCLLIKSTQILPSLLVYPLQFCHALHEAGWGSLVCTLPDCVPHIHVLEAVYEILPHV